MKRDREPPDLENAHADAPFPKSELASKIANTIKARGLTQEQAAKLTGIAQPKISLLARGISGGFGTERLCRILNNLGVTVSLVLSDEPGSHKGLTVVLDGRVKRDDTIS
jgi:predicted XRE-type DNA-binding protein